MFNWVYRREVGFTLIFLSIAVLLRLFYQPFPSFWLDEAAEINFTHVSNGGILNSLLTTQAHPPLHYFIIKGWRLIWGESEFILRFSSFIFFIGTVFFTYLIAFKFFGSRAGRFTAFLASTNYFLIWFSHQVRPYSLAAFLSAGGLYFFLQLVHEPKRSNILGYSLFTVGGLYCSYWAVLLFVAQFIILLLFFRRHDFVKKISVLFINGLIFLPWAILYLIKYQGYYVSEGLPGPNLGMIFESFRYFFWGQAWLVFPAILVGLLLFIKNRNNTKEEKAVFRGLLIYFLFPIICAYLISKFIPIYTPGRREIVVVPALAVISGYLFAQIKAHYWFLLSSILLFILATQAITISNNTMAGFVSSDKIFLYSAFEKFENGDLIFLTGFSGVNFDYYWRDYFRERTKKEIKKIYLPPQVQYNEIELETINEFRDDDIKLGTFWTDFSKQTLQLQPTNKVFVFLTGNMLDAKITEYLDKNFKLEEQIKVPFPRMPTYINELRIYKK